MSSNDQPTQIELPGPSDPTLLRDCQFIDGQWVEGSGDGTLEVLDPATGNSLARIAQANREATRRAIETAHAAFATWSQTPAKQRAQTLRAWHEMILANVEDLAILLTAEQGKPLAEARGEILYGASFIEWYAEEAKRAYGEVTPPPAQGRRLLTLRQPIGVCAAITPWNFPMAMIARKVAPALAGGCAMGIKPAPSTPLSALAMADLADRAGLPAGVLSVICGPEREVGGELLGNQLVRKITFPGSPAVGKLLMSQAAQTVKRVSLELGGNAPFVVFDDADLEAAVQAAIASKFRNAGQTCVCANRILVQSGIHDAFVERFVEATAALKVGNGFQDGVEQGPLIDGRALAKVQDHIADALAGGARIACGGHTHALGGTVFQPDGVTGALPSLRIAVGEAFGP